MLCLWLVLEQFDSVAESVLQYTSVRQSEYLFLQIWIFSHFPDRQHAIMDSSRRLSTLVENSPHLQKIQSSITHITTL